MDATLLRALAEARALGFLGPGPLEAHVASADAFAQALGPLKGRALDLGSGGGVPGLLLAEHYSDIAWTLLDQHRRRTSFLARTVATLGWVGRVEVLRASAEHVAHDAEYRGQFVAVTARSFGPPATTAEIASGYLMAGGVVVVAEPPLEDFARWPGVGLRSLGLERVSSPSPSMAVLRRVGPVPVDVPRPWRSLERRPRW